MIANSLQNCNPLLGTPGKQHTTCLKNVAAFIDAQPTDFDFVGLQEATNWKTIKTLSTNLTKMNEQGYKPDVEDMVSFGIQLNIS